MEFTQDATSANTTPHPDGGSPPPPDQSTVTDSVLVVQLPHGQPPTPQTDPAFVRLLALVRQVAIVNRCATVFHPDTEKLWRKILKRPRAKPFSPDYPRASVSCSTTAQPPPAATTGSALSRVLAKWWQPIHQLAFSGSSRSEMLFLLRIGQWLESRLSADRFPLPEPDDRLCRECKRAWTQARNGLCSTCGKSVRRPLLATPATPRYLLRFLDQGGETVCLEYCGNGVWVGPFPVNGDRWAAGPHNEDPGCPWVGDPHHDLRCIWDDAHPEVAAPGVKHGLSREDRDYLRKENPGGYKAYHEEDRPRPSEQEETEWDSLPPWEARFLSDQDYPLRGGIDFSLARTVATKCHTFYQGKGYLRPPKAVRISGSKLRLGRPCDPDLHTFAQEASTTLVEIVAAGECSQGCTLAFNDYAKRRIRNHLHSVLHSECGTRERTWKKLKCRGHIAHIPSLWQITPDQVGQQLDQYNAIARELATVYRQTCSEGPIVAMRGNTIIRRSPNQDLLEQEARGALARAAADYERLGGSRPFTEWAVRRAWRRLHRICRAQCLFYDPKKRSGSSPNGPSLSDHYHGEEEADRAGDDGRAVESFSLDEVDSRHSLDKVDSRHEDTTPELGGCLRFLHKRQQIVVEMHLGLDGEQEHSFMDIGLELNISEGRAKQIFDKAIEKLRRLYQLQQGVDG